MKENKFEEVNGITIYPLDYLMNEELTDNDLTNLLDHKSLTYSIIVGMFKHIGLRKSSKSIIELVTTKEKWMNNYFWSKSELDSFEDKIAKIIKNIYYVPDLVAKQRAQWYIILYGLKRKGNIIDL